MQLITKIKVNKAEISSLQAVLWFAFPPQAPTGKQQSMEELLAAILAGTQGLFLSPQPLLLQIHPQLLNSPQNVCSALAVPTLQGFAALCSECLKRANTQIHSLAPEQLSLAFREPLTCTGITAHPAPISRPGPKQSHKALPNTTISLLPHL